MSVCNCTGKCKVPPYTCSGICTGTVTVTSAPAHGIPVNVIDTETLTLCSHSIPVKYGNCNLCRFEDIERKLQLIIADVEYHEKYLKSHEMRKPFRCPVCDGYGNWELKSLEEAISNGGSNLKICHSCEGKGVLWG